jgi:hypothetical protein
VDRLLFAIWYLLFSNEPEASSSDAGC